MRRAKLLSRKAVLARSAVKGAGICSEDVSQAIAEGAVRPADGRSQLFSLDDVESLIAFKKGAPAPVAQPVRSEVPMITVVGPDRDDQSTPPAAKLPAQGSKRWAMLLEYMTEHGDPYRLPDEYWAAFTEPPEFVPPVDVFRYGIEGDLRFRKDGEPCSTVRRSEGWVFRADGTLVAVRTNSKYAFVNYDERLFNEDPVPWAAANLRYRELEREWGHAWQEYCRRTGRHPKGDDGRRDRIAILTRYLTNEWSPSDLPPWFWDVPEEPPFVPPLAVSTYEWGEITIREGHPHTEILHSERWQVPDAQLLLEKPGIDDWAPGKFEEGDPLPEEYAAENHRYEWAKAEWSQCYAVHGPHRVRPDRVAPAPSNAAHKGEESGDDPPSSGGPPDRA